MHSDRRPLLILELNEFNDALLRECAEKYKLKNLQRIFKLKTCYTYTQDQYESDFLEPWVQWVSVHTGKSSKEHCIKHLGDIPSSQYPQIWEVLAENGVKANIWGVLNGERGKRGAENIPVFLPDPWTFSEKGCPDELNALLDFPRYAARNRIKPSIKNLSIHLFSFCRFLLSKGMLLPLIQKAPAVIAQTARFGISAHTGFCLLEYISGLLFIDYYKKTKPQFSILFINSIAHLQHYYWEKNSVSRNARFRYGFSLVDDLIGKVLDNLNPGTQLLIQNGLSQMNTNSEPPWVSYRPIDHEVFLKTVGVEFQSVEPLMSYDALIYFPSSETRERALTILRSAKVVGQPLFHVEEYQEDPKKLFYRLQFTDPVDLSEICEIGEKKIQFGEFFKKIIVRTGKHIPAGNLYTTISDFPNRIENHGVFDEILRYFSLSPRKSVNRKPFFESVVVSDGL